VRFRLVPRDEGFYPLFSAAVENLAEAARRLRDLIDDVEEAPAHQTRVIECERRGDEMLREILLRLNSSFVTPFDREDIHALASALDDVLDNIEGVSSRLALFKVKQLTSGSRELIDIIEKGCVAIHEAVKCLRDRKKSAQFLVEINKLENDADAISRDMTAKLFEDAADFRELIKWKELYGRLEATTDDCEDVANIIEGIFVKNN